MHLKTGGAVGGRVRQRRKGEGEGEGKKGVEYGRKESREEKRVGIGE